MSGYFGTKPPSAPAQLIPSDVESHLTVLVV
jgi:hypothetical protein